VVVVMVEAVLLALEGEVLSPLWASCLLEPLEPYSISRCAIRGVNGPSSSSSIKADMPPFMFDIGLGFGFRVRVGGGAVDLGGFVNDAEGGGFELRWVFVVDVELELCGG
jgi:hypothetical protein